MRIIFFVTHKTEQQIFCSQMFNYNPVFWYWYTGTDIATNPRISRDLRRKGSLPMLSPCLHMCKDTKHNNACCPAGVASMTPDIGQILPGTGFWCAAMKKTDCLPSVFCPEDWKGYSYMLTYFQLHGPPLQILPKNIGRFLERKTCCPSKCRGEFDQWPEIRTRPVTSRWVIILLILWLSMETTFFLSFQGLLIFDGFVERWRHCFFVIFMSSFLCCHFC